MFYTKRLSILLQIRDELFRMNRSRTLKIALFIATVILLGNTVAISRDYQDSWVLEGLELSFLLFVITYAAAFFSERRTSWMVILAIIGRTIFLLIPNLKYVWFQGVYIDQHTQYALANHVYNEGYISTIGPSAYISSPLLHLFFSIFSIILDVPIVDAMKYLPVLFSPIYPLLTYIIVKKMEFSEGRTILKYALFLSAVPFSMEQYIVTGTIFGILLAFLILANLIIMFQKNDRRYWLVCTILIFALAAAHSVTSTILMVLLLAIMALQRVSYFRAKSYLRASVAFAIASISAAWLMFPAHFTLGTISRAIFFAVRGGPTPSSEFMPPILFELARADIFVAMRTFSVYYGADLFLLLLTLAGLVILLKKRKMSNDAAKFLLLFGGLAFGVILIGVLLKLGATRTLHFERFLFPIFSGIAVLYISKKTSWIRPIIFSSIILLATLELYGCQPLIPSANVLYKDLPTNVPIGYVNQVNSIYQRRVVNFAYDHLVGRIASDSMTGKQMISLAGYNFSVTYLIDYYPLDKSQPTQKYDFFIIHIPGKSGTLVEQAKIRTPSLILEAIYNSSIVYTNGESYILTNNNAKP